MNTTETNAQRLLHLFDQMRETRVGTSRQRLEALGLSISHIRALGALAPDRTLAMKDLADELALTPPSVTALTRRLVQTGLVRRAAATHDSRVSLLSLTADGHTLLTEMYQGLLQRMEGMLQAFTPAEQVQFLAMMERAVQALQTNAQPAACPKHRLDDNHTQ